MKKGWQAITMAVAICLVGSGALRAQEKDIVIEGQVKAGVHKFKLDNRALYQIEVKAKSFNPNVVLQSGFLQNTADFIKEKNTFRANYMPAKDGEYTIIVSPNVFGAAIPEGLLDYTVTLKTLKLDETPLLKKEEKFVKTDPAYPQSFAKSPYKAYPVQLKKGTTYIVDMVKKKAGDSLDPYLYLENPTKQIVAQDDDSGGDRNARIVFRAPADGEYRIIASCLTPQGSVGDYTLTVRTVKDGK